MDVNMWSRVFSLADSDNVVLQSIWLVITKDRVCDLLQIHFGYVRYTIVEKNFGIPDAKLLDFVTNRLIRIHTVCHAVFDFGLKPRFCISEHVQIQGRVSPLQKLKMKELMSF